MSLEITLQNAISGLHTSQQSLQVISNNIANVNSEGYTRKIIEQTSRVIGGTGYGVELALVSRNVNEGLLRRLRTEGGTLERLTITESFTSQINALFGRPEDNNSLTHMVAELASTMDALAVTPETGATQFQTVKAAIDLTREMENLSDEVQRLRAEANTQIGVLITAFNSAMDSVVDTNTSIIGFAASTISTAELEDQRDIALNKMADIMDITYFLKSDGSYTVFTGGGNTLISGQKQALSYAQPASMAPTVVYTPTTATNYVAPGNANYPVGAIPGIFVGEQVASTDITSNISDGKLKALIDIRDSDLTAIQAQLDELAEKLKNEINKIHNQGAGFPPATTLTGDRYIEGGGLFSGTGFVRIGIVDDSGALQSQDVLTLSGLSDNDAVVAALSAITNLTATINSAGRLELTTSNNYRIAINELNSSVSAAGDVAKGFSDYFGLNNLLASTENYSNYRSDHNTSATADVITTLGRLEFSGNDGTAWATTVDYAATDTLTSLAAAINGNGTLSTENVTAEVVADGAGFRLEVTDAEGHEFAIAESLSGTLLSDIGLRTDTRGISSRLGLRSDIQTSSFLMSRGALQSNTYESATGFATAATAVGGAGGTLTFTGSGLSTTLAYANTDTLTDIVAAFSADATLTAANITAEVIYDGTDFHLKIVDTDGGNFHLVDDGPLTLTEATTQGVTIGDGSVAKDMAALFESTITFLAAPADGTGLAQASTTFTIYSANILSTNSARVNATRRDLDFQEALHIELFNKHASISSVNMDEELANMIIFEQAYLASARIITATTELFDELSQMVG